MADKNTDKGKQKGGKTVEMPTAAIGRLKADAFSRGKREAVKEIEDAAKTAGFNSFNDALVALNRAVKASGNGGGGGGKSRPASDKKPTEAKPEVDDATQAELARLQHERAELKLTLRAERLGLKNADFAVDKLIRKVSKLSDDEVAKFDEDKFFRELQQEQPEVFGKPTNIDDKGKGSESTDKADKGSADDKQEKKPAQTVPTTGGKPSPASTGSDDDENVDVTTMTDEQFAEYKAKHRF